MYGMYKLPHLVLLCTTQIPNRPVTIWAYRAGHEAYERFSLCRRKTMTLGDAKDLAQHGLVGLAAI